MYIYYGSIKKHWCINKTVQKTAQYVLGTPHVLGSSLGWVK